MTAHPSSRPPTARGRTTAAPTGAGSCLSDTWSRVAALARQTASGCAEHELLSRRPSSSRVLHSKHTLKEGNLTKRRRKPTAKQLAAEGRVGVLVKMPPELKAALTRDGENMNNAAVVILAARYDLPFQPTDRKLREVPGPTPQVALRMPPTLKRMIQQEAFDLETNTTDHVVSILADHYGIDLGERIVRRKVPFGGGRKATAATA